MTGLKTLVAGATAFAASVVVSMPTAFAQASTPVGATTAMDMPAMKDQHAGEATKAFQAADHSMMSGMSGVDYTGIADHDFVTHMIPHHQGAVEMAKVELRFGKDAKLRALAKEIIASQDKEIAFMNQWLRAHSRDK